MSPDHGWDQCSISVYLLSAAAEGPGCITAALTHPHSRHPRTNRKTPTIQAGVVLRQHAVQLQWAQINIEFHRNSCAMEVSQNNRTSSNSSLQRGP